MARRNGISITLVTQYDIHLVHAIEEEIKTKLQEFPVVEDEVLKILTHVNVTRRQCESELESTNFDEKKEINKRKQMILEGRDPDLEAKRRKELDKLKEKKRKFQERMQETLEREAATRLKHRLLKKRRKQEKIALRNPGPGQAQT
ncbi:probable ATP-dependent RNA helicase DDX49 [Pristis pectinata]|uniref:probable ATP-dependent RNA helicase DDX49 n=1 Tax=Pristis pectinata TaxID=685728 RepID=UPI00223D16B8|nr:probable ATP-dependent RNA helicase DDX49 [Pristis pectinata]